MTWFRRSAHLEDELSAYADGELGERARRAMEKHLATCEACSTLLNELQDTKALLRELPKVEPRRSLALGSEYAAERRAAPSPRRASFTFAPAVALTFLVALLFVDAIDSTGGSNNDGAFGVTAASRTAEQPESATDLANEALAGAGGAASSVPQDGGASDAAGAAPAPSSDSRSETTGGALAQPSQDPTPQLEQASAPLGSQTPSDDESLSQADKATDSTTVGPEETGQLLDANDSSGGPSTLRILEILAALAFAASLLIVILPRITGR